MLFFSILLAKGSSNSYMESALPAAAKLQSMNATINFGGLKISNLNRNALFTFSNRFNANNRLVLSNMNIYRSFAPFISAQSKIAKSVIIKDSIFSNFLNSPVFENSEDNIFSDQTFRITTLTTEGGVLGNGVSTTFVNVKFENIATNEQNRGAVTYYTDELYDISIKFQDCSFISCKGGSTGAIYIKGFDNTKSKIKCIISTIINNTIFQDCGSNTPNFAEETSSIYLNLIHSVEVTNCRFMGDSTDGSVFYINRVEDFAFTGNHVNQSNLGVNSYVFRIYNMNGTTSLQRQMNILIEGNCIDTRNTVVYPDESIKEKAKIFYKNNGHQFAPTYIKEGTGANYEFIVNGNENNAEYCFFYPPETSEETSEESSEESTEITSEIEETTEEVSEETTPSEESTTTTTEEMAVEGEAKGLSIGAIVGIFIACAFVLIIIVILIIYFCRKDNRTAFINDEELDNVDGFNPPVDV